MIDIIESKVAMSVAEGEVLADRLMEIRDQSHSPEIREVMLGAANMIRKAVPALIVSETVMRYCIENLQKDQLTQLKGVLQDALSGGGDNDAE